MWPKFEDPKVGIHLALTGAIKNEILHNDDLILYLLTFLKENLFCLKAPDSFYHPIFIITVQEIFSVYMLSLHFRHHLDACHPEQTFL